MNPEIITVDDVISQVCFLLFVGVIESKDRKRYIQIWKNTFEKKMILGELYNGGDEVRS